MRIFSYRITNVSYSNVRISFFKNAHLGVSIQRFFYAIFQNAHKNRWMETQLVWLFLFGLVFLNNNALHLFISLIITVIVFSRICMTASRTSPSRSQRMMGMTWRTLSSTRTEKAGSSNWVSLSWWTQVVGRVSIIAVAWFSVISLLCFALFS